MMMGRHRRWGARSMAPVLVVVALMLGAVAYAYAAGNTAPLSSLGASSTGVSGYVVTTGPEYVFSASGEGVSAIRMDLDKSASDVMVALSAGEPSASEWVDCGASSSSPPYVVTCSFPAPVSSTATRFSMAAVQVGKVSL